MFILCQVYIDSKIVRYRRRNWSSLFMDVIISEASLDSSSDKSHTQSFTGRPLRPREC
jgi:hypothetical protein